MNKTIQELESDTREKIILDMRRSDDFERDYYPNSYNIHFENPRDKKEVERLTSHFPKDKPIYVICYAGVESEDVADTLENLGYEAYNLENGYRSYLKLKLSRYFSNEENAVDRHKDIEKSIIKKYDVTKKRSFRLCWKIFDRKQREVQISLWNAMVRS